MCAELRPGSEFVRFGIERRPRVYWPIHCLPMVSNVYSKSEYRRVRLSDLSAEGEPSELPRRTCERHRALPRWAVHPAWVALLAGCFPPGSPLYGIRRDAVHVTPDEAALFNGGEYAPLFEPWVGRLADELVIAWGIPTQSYVLDSGAKIIAYRRSTTVATPVTAVSSTTESPYTSTLTTTTSLQGGVVAIYDCDATVNISPDGRIASLSFVGNDCVAWQRESPYSCRNSLVLAAHHRPLPSGLPSADDACPRGLLIVGGANRRK